MRKIENNDQLSKMPQVGEIVRVHPGMPHSTMIAVIVDVYSSFDPEWDAMMSPQITVLGDQCDIIDVSIYQISSIDRCS